MPQLMPLMWISSVMVSLLILLSLINMYFYVDEYWLEWNLNSLNYNDNSNIKMMW